MSTLLVITAGQTDVQLVDGDVRREFKRDRCGALHDDLERRVTDWRILDAPSRKGASAAESRMGRLACVRRSSTRC